MITYFIMTVITFFCVHTYYYVNYLKYLATTQSDISFVLYLKGHTFVKEFIDENIIYLNGGKDNGDLYYIFCYYFSLVVSSILCFITIPVLIFFIVANTIFPYILRKTIGRFIRKKENEV